MIRWNSCSCSQRGRREGCKATNLAFFLKANLIQTMPLMLFLLLWVATTAVLLLRRRTTTCGLRLPEDQRKYTWVEESSKAERLCQLRWRVGGPTVAVPAFSSPELVWRRVATVRAAFLGCAAAKRAGK